MTGLKQWVFLSGLTAIACRVALLVVCSVVTVQDFAFPVGFDRFLTPNFG